MRGNDRLTRLSMNDPQAVLSKLRHLPVAERRRKTKACMRLVMLLHDLDDVGEEAKMLEQEFSRADIVQLRKGKYLAELQRHFGDNPRKWVEVVELICETEKLAKLKAVNREALLEIKKELEERLGAKQK